MISSYERHGNLLSQCKILNSSQNNPPLPGHFLRRKPFKAINYKSFVSIIAVASHMQHLKTLTRVSLVFMQTKPVGQTWVLVFYRLFVEVPLSTLSHPTLNYAHKKRWIPGGPIAKINQLMYLYLWTQLGAFIHLFIYLFWCF